MSALSEQSKYVQTIWRVMHHIKLQLDEMLAPYDITNRQARLLGVVKAKTLTGREVCQKDLEDAMDLTASSVTSLVRGLEKNGFIRRSAGSADGRTKTIALTQKGAELSEVFLEIFTQAEDIILKGMSEGQRQMFFELMALALENLESAATGPVEVPLMI